MKSLYVLDEVLRTKKRSETLIANFADNGFALGWAWAVNQAFSGALDINLTARFINKKAQPARLTSGRLFAFAKGDTFYDTPLAYSETWAESLTHLQQSIEIVSAASCDESYSGIVAAEFFKKKDGRLASCGIRKMNQAQFVRGLIAGFDT